MCYIIVLFGILNFLLGLFVWYKKWNNRSHIIFALFCFFSATMSFFNFTHRIFPQTWLIKTVYAISSFLPVLAVFWAYELSEKKRGLLKRGLVFLFGLLFFVLSWTDLIIKKATVVTDFGIEKEVGPLFSLFYIYVAFFIFYGIVLMFRARRRNMLEKRAQLTYSLLGLILYAFFASTFSLFLPLLFNIHSLSSLDTPSSFFFVSLNFYAIVRYRLLGIRLLLSKMFVHVVLAIFIFSFFHLIYPLNFYVGGIYSGIALFFGFLASLLFSFIFIPFLKYVSKTSDNVFYKGRNPKTVSDDFIIKMKSNINLEDFFNFLKKELNKTINTLELGLQVIDKQTIIRCFNKNSSRPFYLGNLHITPDGAIINFIKQNKKIIARHENRENKVIDRALDEKNINLLVPLIFEKKLIAVLALGSKSSLNPYNKEDFDFLNIISFHLAQQLNNIFQIEELRQKNKELKKMHKNFFETAGQKLQTPINIVDNILKSVDKENYPNEAKGRVLKSISGRIMKIKEIINDYILSSEIESESMDMQFFETNIVELLKEVIEEKKAVSSKDKIEIEFFSQEEKTKINTDRSYLKQAFTNILNNAIQYSGGEAKIKIKMEIEEAEEKSSFKKAFGFFSFSKSSQDEDGHDKKIYIRITDEGVGIPEEDIPYVFEKFTRAENVKSHSSYGSGLGLFNARKIIEKHKGGELTVESSAENKGTTILIKFDI